MTANHYSNGPVTDVSSEDIRCYQAMRGGGGSTSIYKAKAGGSVTWSASPNIFHPGALSAYMAKVPAGMTAATFDGSGAVWFKIYQEMPSIGGGGMTWASESKALDHVPRNLTSTHRCIIRNGSDRLKLTVHKPPQTKELLAFRFLPASQTATTCSASSTSLSTRRASPSFTSRARR